MSPPMDLDRTDVGILQALQADARLSFRDLARRLGVSVPTISARVSTLRDLGILTGFHAAVDPEKLGQVRVVLLVRFARGSGDAVGNRIAALEGVRWTVRTRDDRIVAEAVLPRAAALEEFLARVRSVPGVAVCEHHVATKALKESPRAVIEDGIAAVLSCFECGQPIEGAPLRIRLDGRFHYLCCPSCERLFRDRYARVRSRAGGSPPRGRPPRSP